MFLYSWPLASSQIEKQNYDTEVFTCIILRLLGKLGKRSKGSCRGKVSSYTANTTSSFDWTKKSYYDHRFCGYFHKINCKFWVSVCCFVYTVCYVAVSCYIIPFYVSNFYAFLKLLLSFPLLSNYFVSLQVNCTELFFRSRCGQIWRKFLIQVLAKIHCHVCMAYDFSVCYGLCLDMLVSRLTNTLVSTSIRVLFSNDPEIVVQYQFLLYESLKSP